MAQYLFMIGTTQAGMTNLEELAVPILPPRYTFTPFSVYSDLGNGMVRGGGWAEAKWIWNADNNDYIPTKQRDQLRQFCPGASATVYIQTYINDKDSSSGLPDAVKKFQAVMIWPQGENRDAKVRRDFVLQFRSLVEVS
jgi:hypothetical protein